MNEKVLFNKLSKILSSLNQDEYPDLYECIENNIEIDDEYVYSDAYDLACYLHDCDTTKLLPKEVSELMIEIYKEEIELGNADAMTNLGSLYYTGRGGIQDYHKAIYYYTLACELGEPTATQNLGYCYYYGRDGIIDYEKAYHCFIKGALSHDLNSLYKIGDMYKNGYYVNKDENLAFFIYNDVYLKMKQYEVYSIEANICLRLGDCYYYGKGTNKDLNKALMFYQDAERAYYKKINDGDYFLQKELESVIERQNSIRDILFKELPNYSWTKKNIC